MRKGQRRFIGFKLESLRNSPFLHGPGFCFVENLHVILFLADRRVDRVLPENERQRRRTKDDMLGEPHGGQSSRQCACPLLALGLLQPHKAAAPPRLRSRACELATGAAGHHRWRVLRRVARPHAPVAPRIVLFEAFAHSLGCPFVLLFEEDRRHRGHSFLSTTVL